MNGYSQTVEAYSNERLLREHARLSVVAKYSGPSQSIHYEYRAVLEELRNRSIDPSKTITTPTGIVIPCDMNGKPHRDTPGRFIRFSYGATPCTPD